MTISFHVPSHFYKKPKDWTCSLQNNNQKVKSSYLTQYSITISLCELYSPYSPLEGNNAKYQLLPAAVAYLLLLYNIVCTPTLLRGSNLHTVMLEVWTLDTIQSISLRSYTNFSTDYLKMNHLLCPLQVLVNEADRLCL